MESSSKTLKHQLLLNDSTNINPMNDIQSNKSNNNNNIIINNRNKCDSVTRNASDGYNQVRNFPSVNEVKFSDTSYRKSSAESNGNYSSNELNSSCYTVRGQLNDVASTKMNKELIGSKLKVKSSRSLDEESFTSASTTTGTISNKKKPKIPDGGYGWVIVLASFVISMIIDGIAFSFGLLYTELLHYFNESKTKTSWIGAFHLSVPLLAGPIISNLVDKYGCRKTTIIGGAISGVGFVLSALSNSVEMLYLTFGLISGFGIGMGYVTAVVSIAFWFDKKRTFATSLGAAGTGIGTFIYAPFTNWLLEAYGWRGTTLILAGTLFNVCVCGCLMRDPDWLIEENRLESRSQSLLTASNSSVCLVEIRKMLEIGMPGETVLDTLVTNVNTEANQQMSHLDRTNILKRYRSETALPTYFYSRFDSDVAINRGSRRSLRRKNLDEISRENIFSVETMPPAQSIYVQRKPKLLASAETLNPSEKLSMEGSNNTVHNGAPSQIQMQIQKRNQIHRSTISLDERLFASKNANQMHQEQKIRGSSLNAILETDRSTGIDDEDHIIDTIMITIPHNHFNSHEHNNMRDMNHRRKRHHRHHNTGEIVSNLRRNIPLRNSHHFQHMRIHRKAMNYRNAMLNTHRYHLKASSCPNIFRNSMTTLAKEEDDKWYDNFIDIIKSIFDFTMFLDPKFFYFNLSTMLLFIWYIVPYFSITDHLLQKNYTEADGANLISVIGVFNTIGMVILGYIGDKPWLNVSKVYAVCLVVCGLSTALMPVFAHNYTYLLILGMIFGISFSSSFSFIPILLVQLVDLDDFTCAYGLVLLVQGLGSLVGPPISGIMYDFTKRWDDAFYAAGFFIAISGILAWVTGILVDRDEEDETEEEEAEDDDDDNKIVKNRL